MDYECGKWLEQLERRIINIELILSEKFPELKEETEKNK